MSRRDRVTRKHSMQRGYGRKNVNPKLSAYQKEQKRNRLANQPPIVLKEQRDSPASARKIASFLVDAAAKRKELHARKYGEKTKPEETNSSATPKLYAAGVEKSLKNSVNNVQSLNQVVAAGTSLDASRVRLEVLAKKAKLRLKKKVRRRAKRCEIEQGQLNRLMSEQAKSDSRKKKNGSGVADMFDNIRKKDDVPLTRAEKKKIQVKKQRVQDREDARIKAIKEQEKAARGGDDDDDDEDNNGETDLPPEDYRGGINDDDDDDEDNESNSDNLGNSDNEDEKPKPKSAKQNKNAAKKQVGFSVSEDDDNNNKKNNGGGQKTRTYNASSKKDFDSFDYVKYGDRVDAPPVLDVVPSMSLAAALERRTRKMNNEANGNKSHSSNFNAKNNSTSSYLSSALDKFRVIDTAGQTSISELAQKTVHGGRTGASDIFQLQQKEAAKNENNNINNRGNGNFLSQSVSGAKLQGKEDFAALRERVMDSYAKHHPKAFGKSRTYTPL